MWGILSEDENIKNYEIAKGYVKLGNDVSVVTMSFKGLKDFEVRDGTL